MTAVYAAPDQRAALRELRALAAPGAELRLLEYAGILEMIRAGILRGVLVRAITPPS